MNLKRALPALRPNSCDGIFAQFDLLLANKNIEMLKQSVPSDSQNFIALRARSATRVRSNCL